MLTASSTPRHNVGGLDVPSAPDVLLFHSIYSTLTKMQQCANLSVCSNLEALPKDLMCYFK